MRGIAEGSTDRLEHQAMINATKFNKNNCWILYLVWGSGSPAEGDLGMVVDNSSV